MFLLILVSSCAGKVINLRQLDKVISSINDWYMERGLFALVGPSAKSCVFHLLIFGVMLYWFMNCRIDFHLNANLL